MLRTLRFLTAGESHGPALTAILDGLPAGLVLDRAAIAHELRRRRMGHGRSQRQQIEDDPFVVTGGVRLGVTLGSPLSVVIENRDHVRWQHNMGAWPDAASAPLPAVTVPRPGHADLAGALKVDTHDVRNVLERASARETAARTVLGAVCKQLLAAVEIHVGSHVTAIGEVAAEPQPIDVATLNARADASPVRMLDAAAAARAVAAIDAAKEAGETLGGVVEVHASGLPAGLGSMAEPDRRLSTRLAAALSSIPAMKGVEVGDGFLSARTPGSQAHDVARADGTLLRASNHAGGVEGGMSNGMPLVVRAAMKPLSTLRPGLPTLDLVTRAPAQALVERTDVCAVPAAAVVAEAMVALVLADAVLEKFGGDSLDQLRAHMAQSARYLR